MKNRTLFKEALKVMPGGVNSPVRSFKAVGGDPLFVKRAKGSKIYSEENKALIDYCLSWGALILGHAHPEVIRSIGNAIKSGTSFGAATQRETRLAQLIVEAIPSIEQVRLTNSGTEAVMGAIRLARAYTKRDSVIKFEGSYHGHADYLLAKAGSGVATLGIPNSLGVPRSFTQHTLVLPYNNSTRVAEVARRHRKNIAAIIVEPLAANCGLIVPENNFLRDLRVIADRYNIVLIFDEVITGFRIGYGGAQARYKVKPDMTCLGKIIGGGLPVGAFGGRKKIMQLLAPQGGVYQAGTLSGNPIAMSAGIAMVSLLKKLKPYGHLEAQTNNLCEEIKKSAKRYNVQLQTNHAASMFSIFFTKKHVRDFKTAKTQDVRLFRRFFHALLKENIYLSPSGFETNFLSTAHTPRDLGVTARAIDRALKSIRT